ncbi:MAG: RNA-binding S4 domain-containing protein [Verrucomicrobiota bacterium]|nr:RNA-binding S4 domain-containing protein [Verrucomicrobiota bacterium]
MNLHRDVRIDKWLWATRLFKTRSLSARACSSGKIQINGLAVKPSRTVKIGDIISAQTGEMIRTFKVLALLEKRVGAKLVSQFLEDMTPASEYAKAKETFFKNSAFRAKGTGRPTKKERRSFETFFH